MLLIVLQSIFFSRVKCHGIQVGLSAGIHCFSTLGLGVVVAAAEILQVLLLS